MISGRPGMLASFGRGYLAGGGCTRAEVPGKLRKELDIVRMIAAPDLIGALLAVGAADGDARALTIFGGVDFERKPDVDIGGPIVCPDECLEHPAGALTILFRRTGSDILLSDASNIDFLALVAFAPCGCAGPAARQRAAPFQSGPRRRFP